MTNAHEDSAVLFAILEAAVDAIIVSDGQGTILRAIPAAAEMFKYDVAEMVGQNVNMLMPQALAEIHDGFMSHHTRRGRNGSSGSGAMLRDNARTLLCFHCTFWWVTQRSVANTSSSESSMI